MRHAGPACRSLISPTRSDAQLDGFYPYFFIDVSQLGWPRMLKNASGMLIAFVVLCLVFAAISKAKLRTRLG